MTLQQVDFGSRERTSRLALYAALSASVLLGACAQSGSTDLAALSLKNDAPRATAKAEASTPATELQKATEYWGKEYVKNPTDLKKALNYARNLKAMGQKPQALSVLQQASMMHGQDRELASEYGRLALDLGQVKLAQKMLAFADDPTKPDWRVLSARGAAFAKQEKFSDAIPLLERAKSLAPDQPSVLNNLAVAYVMNGEAQKAEAMLRRATTHESAHAEKVHQNLALVLGLQGKYDEAKRVGTAASHSDVARSDVALLKQIVKIEPQHSAPAISSSGTAVAGWSASVVDAAGKAK